LHALSSLLLRSLFYHFLQLQDQLAPLTRRIDAKTREKDRTRSLKDSEVNSRQNALLEFQGDAKELHRLTKAVDEFSGSTKPQELERIADQVSLVLARIEKKGEELRALGPELESARTAVQDQNRHKKMLRENIDIMESEVAIKENTARIQQLQEKLASVEGGETAADDYRSAQHAKEKRVADKNRLEGRWHEIVEKIRTLKRKLSTEEYKDVDEQFRSANIKYHTTMLAAEDVKKYWNAVDKALLQFHAVKIKVRLTLTAPIPLIRFRCGLLTGTFEPCTAERKTGNQQGKRLTNFYATDSPPMTSTDSFLVQ
jgi:DNA repair protein RAD50